MALWFSQLPLLYMVDILLMSHWYNFYYSKEKISNRTGKTIKIVTGREFFFIDHKFEIPSAAYEIVAAVVFLISGGVALPQANIWHCALSKVLIDILFTHSLKLIFQVGKSHKASGLTVWCLSSLFGGCNPLKFSVIDIGYWILVQWMLNWLRKMKKPFGMRWSTSFLMG